MFHLFGSSPSEGHSHRPRRPESSRRRSSQRSTGQSRSPSAPQRPSTPRSSTRRSPSTSPWIQVGSLPSEGEPSPTIQTASAEYSPLTSKFHNMEEGERETRRSPIPEGEQERPEGEEERSEVGSEERYEERSPSRSPCRPQRPSITSPRAAVAALFRSLQQLRSRSAAGYAQLGANFDRHTLIPLLFRLAKLWAKLLISSLVVLKAVNSAKEGLRAAASLRVTWLRRLGIMVIVTLRSLFRFQGVSKPSLSTALFVANYPTAYRLLSVVLPMIFPFLSGSSGWSEHLLLTGWAAALPGSILAQLNLYGVSAAVLALVKSRYGSRNTETTQGETSHGTEGEQVEREPTPPHHHLPYWLRTEEERQQVGQNRGATEHGEAGQEAAEGATTFDRHFGWLSQQSPSAASYLHRWLRAGYLFGRRQGLRSFSFVRWALENGGGWWLFPLAQGWLLYCAVFESDCFPSTYRRIIVSRSTRYLPSPATFSLSKTSVLTQSMPEPNQLMSMIPLFTMDPHPFPNLASFNRAASYASAMAEHSLRLQYLPVQSIIALADIRHVRTLCATLHPLEPSCWKNWINSLKEAFPSAAALVGGWSAMVALMKWNRFKRQPLTEIRKWIGATLRGASFITLAICSAWGYVCLFQRLLPAHTFRRGRFAVGGILAGLWIFLVPAARRLELGMYAFRLSLLSFYSLAVKRNWIKYRRSTAALPLAISLSILTHCYRTKSHVLEGWVGDTVSWLERERDQYFGRRGLQTEAERATGREPQQEKEERMSEKEGETREPEEAVAEEESGRRGEAGEGYEVQHE